MFHRAARILVAPIALWLVACAARGESTPSSSQEESASASPSTGASAAPSTASAIDGAPFATMSEARIVGVARALASAASELARQGAAQAADSRIKLHAMVVGADADGADASLRRAGASEDSSMSRGVVLDAHLRQVALQSEAAPSAEFDRAYLGAEVQLDAAALGLIDALTVGNAIGPDVQKAMGDLRGHVAEHLRDALRIQDALAATK